MAYVKTKFEKTTIFKKHQTDFLYVEVVLDSSFFLVVALKMNNKLLVLLHGMYWYILCGWHVVQ